MRAIARAPMLGCGRLMRLPRSLSLVFALAVGGLVAFWSACGTDHVTLGNPGDLCDYDQQCDPAQGLICACVKVQNPDDEGGDQIVAHGHCSKPGVSCGGDGGVDGADGDTSSLDAGASDADDATDGAVDTSAADANDAG